MESSSDASEGSGSFIGKLARRTRSGNRVWSEEIKGRAVFKSMKPGARVCDVAQRYGVRAQQLTTWRRLARNGQIALITDEPTDFVKIAVSEPMARAKDMAPVEIAIGKVKIRLDADAPATRIAEIAAALERCA